MGTDLLGGKFTLPVLMLLQSASQEEQVALRELLLKKETISRESLVAIILEQGALTAAIAEASHLIDQAEATLEILAKNDYVNGLHSLASYLRGLLPSQ